MKTLSRAHDCDFCKRHAAELPVIYDAKIPFGPWEWLCQTCFNDFNCSLGTGCGQKFDNRPGGKKLAG